MKPFTVCQDELSLYPGWLLTLGKKSRHSITSQRRGVVLTTQSTPRNCPDEVLPIRWPHIDADLGHNVKMCKACQSARKNLHKAHPGIARMKSCPSVRLVAAY